MFRTEVFFICRCAFLHLVLSGNVIDVDDILSENYMPGNLLVLNGPLNSSRFNDGSDFSIMATSGSFGNAVMTMEYHRYK